LGARTWWRAEIDSREPIAGLDGSPSPDQLLEQISLGVQKVIAHRPAGVIGGSFAQHLADRAVMGDGPASFFGRDGREPQCLPITGRSRLVERGDQADENIVLRRLGDGKVECAVPLYPILIVFDLGRAPHAGLDVQEIGFTRLDRGDRGHRGLYGQAGLEYKRRTSSFDALVHADRTDRSATEKSAITSPSPNMSVKLHLG